MCNIHTKTSRKHITVYKVVIKINKDYYSFFAGCKIEIGGVKSQDPNFKPRGFGEPIIYKKNDFLYNENMVGKSSGFLKKRNAIKLCRETLNYNPNKTVLKIKLGGEIWQGDATNVSGWSIPDSEFTFAGSEILSFEEIKF